MEEKQVPDRELSRIIRRELNDLITNFEVVGMHDPVLADAITFVNESYRREAEKMSTLGPYDPLKDDRSMANEAQQEAIDILSYMRFQQRKYPHMSASILVVKKKAFDLFRLLRIMEEHERKIYRVTKGGGIEGNQSENSSEQRDQ